MKIKQYQICVNGKTYVVPVTYKKQRGIYLRAKNGEFIATSPLFAKEETVIAFLNKSLPILIARINKKYTQEKLVGENYTYILGERIEKTYTQESLKKFALAKFSEITRIYEKKMGISKPYKVRVRVMSSRYGSNSSKTHSLTFQLSLIHYSEEIITSVIVHELAHEFYRNHQKKFYDLLLKYCPNYYELKHKLNRGICK